MKSLRVFLFVALAASFAFPQNVRYDAPFPSISSSTSTPYLLANIPPNSPVLAVCNSPANAVPCSNYATTFTSTGAACPSGSQDTPQPQPSACQSTGDAQGNIGFFATPGVYAYTVCILNSVSCFGPYEVILGVGGGACLLTGGAGCVMTGPIEGNVSFTDPLLGAATGGSAIEDATGNSVTTGYSTAGSYAFVNLSTAGQLAQLKLGNNGGLGGILFAARGDQIEIGAGGIELFASGSDTITVAGPLDLPSELIDSTGSGGTPGQLLSSIAGTPPKTRWITPPIRTCQTGLGDGLNAIPSGTY